MGFENVVTLRCDNGCRNVISGDSDTFVRAKAREERWLFVNENISKHQICTCLCPACVEEYLDEKRPVREYSYQRLQFLMEFKYAYDQRRREEEK